MVKYPNINDKDFQLKIKKIFNEYKMKHKKKSIHEYCYPTKFTFQLPQLFVAEFLNPKTPYKGILLYHRIGAGKTCAGIQIAEKWKEHKKIILVGPASLIGNFYKELRSECTGNIYITKNERKLLSETLPSSKNYHEIIDTVNERIHKYYELYSYHKFTELVNSKKISLKNKVLIIDEVHNIISESGTFYTTFKKAIDNTPNDFRIVIMSATPIYDKPEELGLTMNLLKPKKDFPDPDEFNKIFLNREITENGVIYTLKNEELLSTLLQGYVSYYAGAPAFVFPKMKLKYVKCKMNKFQLDAYKSFVNHEKQGLFLQSTDILKLPNSFLLGGRFISNVAYPNRKFNEKGSDSFANSYLNMDNLKKFSIKFYKILKKVNRCNGPTFFYSNFKEQGGIEDFRKVLEYHGYSNFLEEGKGRKRYAVWSGDENTKEKDLIRETLNSKDNEDGSQIKIILGSPAIKEGVSLLRIRQVHILEPYWNMSRLEQVIGRAVRFCSHKDLPRSERIVDVYIYLAITSSTSSSREPSIDQQIMSLALRKKILVDEFQDVLKKSSIDYYLFNDQ
jgi:superfamily II DNA or RNA helicase